MPERSVGVIGMVVLGECSLSLILWWPRMTWGHCRSGVSGVAGAAGGGDAVDMSRSEGSGAAAAQDGDSQTVVP